MDLEIDRYADPAVLGHVALLGRDEAPALDRGQGRIVELLAPTALLDLDLSRFAAGQHMYPKQHRAFPAPALGQGRIPGAGFFKYAALAEAGVTGAGAGGAGGAGAATGAAGWGAAGACCTGLGAGLGSGLGTGFGLGLGTGLGGGGFTASSSSTGGGGSTTGWAGCGGGGSTTGGAGCENSMVMGGISGGTTGSTGVDFWLNQ